MKSYFLIFLALMTGCAGLSVPRPIRFDLSKFDTILLGDADSRVIEILGKPDEIILSSDSSDHDENWLYKDHDEERFQVAAVSLDKITRKVLGVTVIPRENEAESKLSGLKSNKFPNLIFEEYPLKRCRRDYFPAQIYYINKDQGVAIVFDKNNKNVESYTRMTPSYAKDIALQIINCKR